MAMQISGIETTTWKRIGASLLAMVLTGLGGAAQATTLNTCPLSFFNNPAAKVENAAGTMTAVSNCQYLTPPDPSNVGHIADINAAGFFGFSDWTVNAGNGQVNPSNDQLGTWAITGVNFAAYDYMIVFKDGRDTNLVAFLFNEQFVNGVWSTPFTSPPFDVRQPKDVSHYTIAQRLGTETPCDPRVRDCGGNEVPEPDGIALISLGMLGAALALKRRR